MQKINPVQTFAWNALEQHKAEQPFYSSTFCRRSKPFRQIFPPF